MTGVVMKILSEFCYIKHVGGIVVCKTKGIFRHKNMKVITGDVVEFNEPQDQEAYGMITDIYDRKSELYRPQIANIDQVVVISSVKDPNFDSYILNKYLTFISYLGIKKIIAFTKVDLIKRDDVIFDYIDDYQKIGIEIFRINNIQPASEEWEPFNQILVNKTSVFTGQTGAGKSTTLNNLLPNVFQKTQAISKALGRGKHTTTSNELFEFNGGFIADTPGFSSFELKDVTPLDVAQHYLNFNQYECKFNDCLHNVDNEKICGVVAAKNKNEIPAFMYSDYVKLLLEFTNKRGVK
jgi:ribosome biogenesis GTPase